jgi:hypothetical protein
MTEKMPRHSISPEEAAELRAWFEKSGLKDATELGVFENDFLDSLNPEQRRFLHALLEARYQLDHGDRTEEK